MLTAPEKWLYRRGIFSVDRLSLPHVLGIGVPRAGTTWLYFNLCAHPQVQQRSTPKELHYFNKHFGRPLSWYAAQFAEGEGVRVDVSPSYVDLPKSRIEFIRGIMPDVRVILLLRSPIDQAWSETLLRLVKRPGVPFESVDDDRLEEKLRKIAISTDYVAIRDRWESVIPSEQFFIGYFEDVSQRPRRLLKEVFEFIGVEADVDWEQFPYDARINPNPPAPIPSRYRAILESINRPRISALRARFGSRADSWFEEGDS